LATRRDCCDASKTPVSGPENQTVVFDTLSIATPWKIKAFPSPI
jgi:hypothetical protein